MVILLLILILCALLFGRTITALLMGVGLFGIIAIGIVVGLVFFAINDIEGFLGILFVILLFLPSIKKAIHKRKQYKKINQ